MIHSVTVKCLDTGDEVEMNLAYPELSQGFAVLSMDGLGPGTADMSVNNWVMIDGGNINHTQLPARDISLKLQFVPTVRGESVADIRRKTYVYFPLMKKVRLTFKFYAFNGYERHYYIEGTVKRNDPDIWSEAEGCTIAIVCPDPYFKDTEVTSGNFNRIDDWFHFEFPDESMDTGTYPIYDELPSVSGYLIGDRIYLESEESGWLDLYFLNNSYQWEKHGSTTNVFYPISELVRLTEKDISNSSSVVTGGVFYLKAMGTVEKPSIYNRTTNEKMTLNLTMHRGDGIVIDTRKGYKSIHLENYKNVSRLQYLQVDSKWINILPGTNTIGISAINGVDHLHMQYEIRPLYQGV